MNVAAAATLMLPRHEAYNITPFTPSLPPPPLPLFIERHFQHTPLRQFDYRRRSAAIIYS